MTLMSLMGVMKLINYKLIAIILKMIHFKTTNSLKDLKSLIMLTF